MIGLESLLAGSKESSSVFANEEMGAIRKAELLLAFKDELGAALSVGLGCSCHLRDALADGGAKNDDGGFAHKSLGKVDCALRLLVSAQAQETLRGRDDSSRTQDTSWRVQYEFMRAIQ